MDIAKSISEGLARKVLAAEVNGEVWDLSRPLNSDSTFKLRTWDDEKRQEYFLDSSAHLMAEAVESAYGGEVLGWRNRSRGIYYDMDMGGHH